MATSARKHIQEIAPDAHVEELVLDLSRLEEGGVFLVVKGGGHSQLEGKLDFKALGIEGVPRGLAMRIGQPSIGFLPDQHRLAIKSSIAAGYRLIRHYGMEFSVTQSFFGNSGHRWVNQAAFVQFEEEFNRELSRLEMAKQAVLADYDGIVGQMHESFTVLADSSVTRFQKQGVELDDGFRDRLVAALMAKVPTKDYIRDSIFLKRNIGVLMFGSEMYAERTKALAARSEALAAKGDLDAREAVLRERARNLQLQGDQERLYRQQELRKEAEEKDRIRLLKRNALEEALKEQVSPLREAAMQLHFALNKEASELLAGLQKHGFVHGAAAEKARRLAEWFKLMNWTNDVELEKLVSSIQNLAGSAPDQRDPIQFQTSLEILVQKTHAEAKAATKSSRFMALEF